MIMTQEEKQLLLKDLSARLPYGVVCYNSNTENNFKLCDTADIDSGYPTFDYGYGELETVKPYLRSLSSMTEEEKKELKSATCPEGTGYFNEQYLICPMSHSSEHISYDFMSDILNWLNAHHFDYRGLIEKGLAIEVTEENNPYKIFT